MRRLFRAHRDLLGNSLADAFAGTLTRGGFKTIPATEETTNMQRIEEDSWLMTQSLANLSHPPAIREFNREFFKFGPFSAILAPNQLANSNACSKIPWQMEQGIFLTEQGIIFAEQGILAPRIGNWTSDHFFSVRRYPTKPSRCRRPAPPRTASTARSDRSCRRRTAPIDWQRRGVVPSHRSRPRALSH